MMIVPKIKPRLAVARGVFGIAAASVALLACLPQTGWIVRQQLRGGAASAPIQAIMNPGAEAVPTARDNARVQALANARPGDFAFHLASALRQNDVPAWTYDEDAPRENSPTHRRAQRVWKLRDQFPNEPALYATYLRLSCIHGGIGRDLEQELLTTGSLEAAQSKIASERTGKAAKVSYWEANPEWVATLADAARTGERLDPGNAYFPLMLAVCQFSQKRDTDALAALDRAGASHRFDGYCPTETSGLLGLSKAEYGPTGAIAQTAIVAAQLLPDLASLRGVARIAVAKAILREQTGDLEGGLKIRRSVARIGALMRHDSSSVIGSFVGIAIVQIAAVRPGGAAPLRETEDFMEDSNEERMRLSRDRYVAYLNKVGQGNEARWFAEEARRGEQVRSIAKKGLDRSVFGGVPLLWIGVWWGVCYAFLVTALWMLLGGGIGAWVARGARVRDAAPLHVAARYALGAALVAPGVLVVAALPPTEPAGVSRLPFSAFAAVLCAPIFFLLRDPTGTRRELSRAQRHIEAKRSLKIYGKVLALTLGALALVGVTFPVIFSGVKEAVAMFSLLGNGEAADNSPFPRAGYFLIAVGAFSLLGIVLTGLFSLVWSLKRRVPASVGLALGFRAVALPVASLWLLLYTGAVVQTSRVETQASREIEQSRQHEGRYLSGLADEMWPQLTPQSEGK